MKQTASSSLDPSPDPLRVLFATSEAHPLIKSGGLGDVSGSLPPVLQTLGTDIRLILPAYPQAVANTGSTKVVATIELADEPGKVQLLEGRLMGRVPVYLVAQEALFNRTGGPYTDSDGYDWPDNPHRFAHFCKAVVAIAMDRAGLEWSPQVVHCNDWQTGLIPALLAQEQTRPATIFTIHNLSYQGVYDYSTFQQLKLPEALWSSNGLEFYGNFSFLKGGLAYADRVTAVSPAYAKEICTPQFGYGLEGLLQHRSSRLSGILNGIDDQVWNPSTDPEIVQHYNPRTFELKAINKTQLQQEMGLNKDPKAILFCHIGRIVEQKGVDLIIDILPRLMQQDKVQLAMLGMGDHAMESALLEASRHYPGRFAVRIGYDEPLAHRIEAGGDIFLMPSRFEPCGLNQLYSLRYGTVPIVHRTGGLADTVVNLDPITQVNATATGFMFDQPTPEALWEAIELAIEHYRRPGVWWRKLAIRGMSQDFSWRASARRYLELYREATEAPTKSS